MTGLTATWGDDPVDPPEEPLAHFQTVHYDRVLRRYGQRPCWLRVAARGETVATWLLFETPSDYVRPPRNPLVRWLDRNLNGLHGPVVRRSPEVEPADVVAVVVEALADRLRARPVARCSIALEPTLEDAERDVWRRAAAAAGLVAEDRHTWLATVDGDDDILFARLRGDRRTKIRKAVASGVEVVEGADLEAFRRYHQAREDTARRNGLPPVPFAHFEATRAALDGTGIYHALVASVGGRVAAGQVVFRWGRFAYLSGVSIADWALRERVPANDLLQWEVLRWCRDAGAEVVDFAGASDGVDPKLAAIDSFKSRWGTVRQPVLTIGGGARGVRPVARRLASALRSMP